jgi:hypothetical protein
MDIPKGCKGSSAPRVWYCSADNQDINGESFRVLLAKPEPKTDPALGTAKLLFALWGVQLL